MLTKAVHGATGGVGVASFLKTLKKTMGQMHVVCSQMVAREIISMNVADLTKVGTEKISGRISQ